MTISQMRLTKAKEAKVIPAGSDKTRGDKLIARAYFLGSGRLKRYMKHYNRLLFDITTLSQKPEMKTATVIKKHPGR